MELHENALRLRKRAGLSQTELGNKVGASLATISRLENGKWKGNLSLIIKIAEVLNVAPGDLDESLQQFSYHPTHHTGDSPQVFEPGAVQESQKAEFISIPFSATTHPEIDGESVYLPHYKISVSAGNGLLAHEPKVNQELPFKVAWVRNTIRTNPDNLFLVDVQGDSMEPTFMNGDIVMVDKSKRKLHGGFYIFNLDDDLYIKRVERIIDGRIHIKSDNTSYDSFIIEPQKISGLKVIGRVVWRAQTLI